MRHMYPKEPKTKQGKILCLSLYLGFIWFASLLMSCQCQAEYNISRGRLSTNLPGTKTPILLFSNAIVGQRSKRVFRLFNSGNQPLKITSMSLKGKDHTLFSVKHPLLPLELLPGKVEGIELTATFSPLAKGQHEARLILHSPDTQGTEQFKSFSILLRSPNLQPHLEMSCPKVISFTRISLGTYREKTCVMTNTGSAPLDVQGFEQKVLQGTPEGFTLKFSSSLPAKIRPKTNDKLILKIRYKPIMPYTKISKVKFLFHTNLSPHKTAQVECRGDMKIAKLKITPVFPPCLSSEECQILDTNLRCYLEKDEAGRCTYKDITERKRVFPLTEIGQTTSELFTIESLNTFPVRITELPLKNANTHFHVEKLTFPVVLPPKGKVKVRVFYTPKHTREESNTIEVKSIPMSAPQPTIKVETSWSRCRLQVHPNKVEFKQREQIAIRVRNIGNRMCFIKSLSLEKPQDTDFQIDKKWPRTLGPGVAFYFSVGFFPKGSFKASQNAVFIRSSDPIRDMLRLPISWSTP